MAKVQLNATIGGISGKMDGWVYRRRHGQTEVMPVPSARKGRPSAAQRAGRERFTAAQAYASEVMADPLRRALYQKLGAESRRPPNALLIANFLTPPAIEQIELGGYTGAAGDKIRILATDLVEVVAVNVSIRNAADALLESGPAQKDHGIWIYETQKSAPAGAGRQIEVTARNRARAESRHTVPVL